MRRSAPWVLVIVLLVALATVWFGYRQRGAQIALMLQTQRQLDKKEQGSQRRVRQLQDELDRAKGALAANTAKASSQRPAATGQSTPLVIQMEDMRKNPKYAPLWQQDQLRNIQRMYGAAIAALKLPPDQEAKLRSLLMDQAESAADARQAAAAAGLSRGEGARASVQASEEVGGEIKALIGDDGYAALQTGSRLANETSNINYGVGADLAANGVPLTPDQTGQLAKLYADVRPGPFNPNGDPAALSSRDQQVLDHAANFLSAPQVAAMKQSLLTGQLRQQFFNEQRAAQGTGSGPGVSGSSMTIIQRGP